jgi:MFS family permease
MSVRDETDLMGVPEQAVDDKSAGGASLALELLKVRDFRFALISSAILVFGFEMRAVVQSWLALELTDSQAWVGAVNGLPAIVMIALSLVGGLAADRFPKRDILVVVRLFLASLMLVAGYLVATDVMTIWYLLAMTMISGGFAAFGMPAVQSLVVELAGRKRVLTASSLMQTVGGLGLILGPALGGFLLGLFGVAPVFFIIAGIQFVGLLATLMIRSRKVHNTKAEKSSSAMSDIAEGLRFVRGNPLVRMLMLMNILAMFAGFMFPLIPVYARDVLVVGESGYGMMMGAFGLGGVIGSVSLAMAGNVKKKANLVMGSIGLWIVGTFVFAFSRDYYLSLVVLVVMGAGGIAYVTTINAMVQMAIPDELRGRVTSLFSITMTLFPVGMFVGGVLAAATTNEISIMTSGVGVALPVLLVYVFSRRFREMS